MQASTGRAIIQLTESGENSISALAFRAPLINSYTPPYSFVQRRKLYTTSPTHAIRHRTIHAHLTAERDPIYRHTFVFNTVQIANNWKTYNNNIQSFPYANLYSNFA